MKSFDEPTVSCPFNPEHKMRSSKLIWHIGKGCKEKELYEHLFGTCPYNAIHIFKKELLPAHILECSDREKYGRQVKTREQELIEAMNQQLDMEEHKSGETPATWFTPLEIQNQYEIKAWDSGYYENQMKVPEGDYKKPTMEVEGQGGWWQGQTDSWGGSWPEQTQENTPPIISNEYVGQNNV